MTGPRFTSLIAALPETVPFVGPDEHERAMGKPFRARLGANESIFGPSPAAVAAMQEGAPEIWKYPDSTSHDLKTALATHIACPSENIVVGEGIDGLLGYCVRLLVAPGDAVVTSDGAYPTFNYHVAVYGGVLHKVPYREDREDIDALFDLAAKVNAKIVYLANPDNPMASWHDGRVIEEALSRLPEGVTLILDEAYIEFAPVSAVPDIAFDDPRVIRFRTFSKAYGMAGARVGYAVGARPLIKAFDKVRNHFGMNRTAQAGAVAALADQVWLRDVVGQVATARDEIARIANANGLHSLPSATNFVAIDCTEDGAFARKVLQSLMEQGVFVRMPFVAPQDRCLRVSAGRPEDMAIFEEALPIALRTARSG